MAADLKKWRVPFFSKCRNSGNNGRNCTIFGAQGDLGRDVARYRHSQQHPGTSRSTRERQHCQVSTPESRGHYGMCIAMMVTFQGHLSKIWMCGYQKAGVICLQKHHIRVCRAMFVQGFYLCTKLRINNTLWPDMGKKSSSLMPLTRPQSRPIPSRCSSWL